MYWNMFYVNIPAFKTSAFHVWVRKFIEWLKSEPGFQSQIVLNSYSYPTHYMAIHCWERRAAARASLTSVAYEKFLEANSSDDIFTPRRPYEAYEAVLTVGDTTKAGAFVSATEWKVDPEKSPIFEQMCSDQWELYQKVGRGFGFGRVYRLMGNTSRYLTMSFYTQREDYIAGYALSELRAFSRAHPYTEYAMEYPSVEQYEVIIVAGGSST